MFAEYDQYDATGLAALVTSGAVQPSQLWDAAMAKIAAGEPKFNALLEILPPPATPPVDGPFTGVPFIFKDVYQDYKGARHCIATAALKDNRATKNDEITNRFLRTGIAPAGISHVPELGLKGTTETALCGATRNPWDPTRTPGGSSGGSAAAIAAGYVPMAGGNDGGGSIRIPAAYCGLFGLKPSTGRTPFGPEFGDVWDGACVNGVLSRSVRDSAAMLDAIAGPDIGAPTHIAPPERPYLQEVGAKLERLRVGFSTRSPIGTLVAPEQITAVRNTAALLESLGHHVEEAAPAIDGIELAHCFLNMMYAHTAAAVRRICAQTGAREASFATDIRIGAMVGRAMSGEAFVSSRMKWNKFARAMGAFHERYDIYLTPVTAMGPAKIGALEMSKTQEMISKCLLAARAGKLVLKAGLAEKVGLENLGPTPFTQLANLTFCPAMSVPLHWGADGLPVGVQFSAKFGAEGLLFRLAGQLEQALPWGGRRCK
jgi:amidase